MQIRVEEEYGYRYWIWTPPFEEDWEVIEWWKTNMTSEFVNEFVFYDITEIEGEWEEVDYSDYDEAEFDGTAHVHESTDTWLCIGNEKFNVEGAESSSPNE